MSILRVLHQYKDDDPSITWVTYDVADDVTSRTITSDYVNDIIKCPVSNVPRIPNSVSMFAPLSVMCTCACSVTTH